MQSVRLKLEFESHRLDITLSGRLILEFESYRLDAKFGVCHF